MVAGVLLFTGGVMKRRRTDKPGWDSRIECPKRAMVNALMETMDPDEREEFLHNIRQEEAA